MGWRFAVGTLITLFVLMPNVLCLPSLLAGFKPDPRQQPQHKQPQQHKHHEADQPEVESAEDLSLNADGSYSYKYRLSDGTFSYAKANSAGEVNGGYGYKNEEGQDVVIEFQASKDVGFQPRGSHLNEVPALPGITNEEAIAADVNYDENADRSYKFDFEGDDFSRNEESDSTGQIMGNYRFVDSDGQERSVSYKAGAGIGFVPEADFIPQDSNRKSEQIFGQKMAPKSYTQSSSQTAPAISILPPPAQEHSGRHNGYPAAVKNPQKFYSRPQKTPIAVFNDQPEGSESSIATVVKSSDSSPAMVMDASYSFAYDNDLTAREESADQQGNINGQYTYVNTEGNLIQVKYSAGAEKGFVIENESELSEAVDKATQDGTLALQQEQQAAGVNRPKSIDAADITFVGPNIDDSTWIQDKSYTFGFRGQESSRSEVSDENGNVRGTYTIPDTEGKPILVRYTAGPKKGFVIENLEEVQRRTGQLSGVSNVAIPKQNVVVKVAPRPVVKQQQQQQQQQGHSTSQSQIRPQVTAAPPISVKQDIQNNVQNQHQQYKGDESDVSSDHTDSDKSYNFEFGLSDNQRKETADEEGNIHGQYEYVTAEGNKIRVFYSAGPGKGFVIENQEDLTKQLAKATYDGAAALDKVRSESETNNNNNNRKVVRKGERRPNIATTTTATSTSSSRTSAAAPLPISTSYLPPSESGSGFSEDSFADQDPEPQTAMDASFSFAVDSSNSNHQESADSTGERQGSYSYTSPEGKNVVVRYRAGRKGFVILNPDEVIPKPF